MEHKISESALTSLEEIDGVSSVREQAPHVVLTVDHPPLDDAVTLQEIEARSNREHEQVVSELPPWAEVVFTNAIEIFVNVREVEE